MILLPVVAVVVVVELVVDVILVTVVVMVLVVVKVVATRPAWLLFGLAVWITMNAVTERVTTRRLGKNSDVNIWPKSNFP